jgi:DNA-binding NarL/FixJ family response regulator
MRYRNDSHMKHYLITSVKAMSSRWQQAFPHGTCIDIDDISTDLPSIVWLDLSTRTAEEKEQLLRKAVICGQTVMALSTAPSKQEAMSIIRLGGKGYGHLMAATEQFQQMAAVVTNGGYWLGQDLITAVVQESSDAETASRVDDGRSQLTGRECNVADEVARGASNREIAERLSISERTVKAHLSVIFEKLQLRDRVQLALKLNRVSI